jgi:hypothetical protein
MIDTHLKMRTGNGFGQLVEEGFLDFGKLGWVHDFEDILNFIQEHDFLSRVDFRPVSK